MTDPFDIDECSCGDPWHGMDAEAPPLLERCTRCGVALPLDLGGELVLCADCVMDDARGFGGIDRQIAQAGDQLAGHPVDQRPISIEDVLRVDRLARRPRRPPILLHAPGCRATGDDDCTREAGCYWHP